MSCFRKNLAILRKRWIQWHPLFPSCQRYKSATQNLPFHKGGYVQYQQWGNYSSRMEITSLQDTEMVNLGLHLITTSVKMIPVVIYFWLTAHLEQFSRLDEKKRERHSKFAGSKGGNASQDPEFVFTAVSPTCTLWWAQPTPRTENLVQNPALNLHSAASSRYTMPSRNLCRGSKSPGTERGSTGALWHPVPPRLVSPACPED